MTVDGDPRIIRLVQQRQDEIVQDYGAPEYRASWAPTSLLLEGKGEQRWRILLTFETGEEIETIAAAATSLLMELDEVETGGLQ